MSNIFISLNVLCVAPPSIATSLYSSALTDNSPTYSCTGCLTADHYYEAIHVTIPTSGYYNFTSISAVPTNGALYINTFNASDPWLNLITENDASNYNVQFAFSVFLELYNQYILVVSSYRPSTIDSFTVTVAGTSYVSLSAMSSPSTTTTEYT